MYDGILGPPIAFKATASPATLTLDGFRNPVELVESMVRTETKRLALHLEVPAGAHRTAAQLAVRGELRRSVGPMQLRDVGEHV